MKIFGVILNLLAAIAFSLLAAYSATIKCAEWWAVVSCLWNICFAGACVGAAIWLFTSHFIKEQ